MMIKANSGSDENRITYRRLPEWAIFFVNRVILCQPMLKITRGCFYEF